ncbi:hypothetical protein [Stenotrophomonas oahuensis]|uniref:DUF4239 domain-containing protein n=1 Tax=Stenotrophomonas oahuensis TaxID=3003271 RepID=A0ABY9YMA0_9GAMM|nr:hypothetical protein [Stenotrophomonas sp. A5586]WNH52018.1 hypothetical protein PDM29_16990 [Stenotrophomonas sp. A5586]
MDLPASYPTLPPWLLTLCFLLALLVAREIGAAVSRRQRRRHPARTSAPEEGKDDDAFAMTSVLGLLALLIGFTFSLSLGRYDERRQLVVQEANALGTTWLRTDLLDGNDRTRMQDVLRRYVDARVDFANARTGEEEVQQNARSVALQDELWQALVAGTQSFRDTPRASLLFTTTNESIDLAAERFAARQDHIPPRILRMLLLFAVLAAGLVGYERPHQRRSTLLLLLLLTLAVGLILDLDRPSTGITQVPQEPMLDLQRSLRDGEAP